MRCRLEFFLHLTRKGSSRRSGRSRDRCRSKYCEATRSSATLLISSMLLQNLRKKSVLWLPLDETSKVVAKLDERFADCAVVCGTQLVHYLKREDDTCIATALNSSVTRDERLTTHRLMPVEKVAAGVATSPPLQTPPQQHNADITVGNFVLVRFETNRCSIRDINQFHYD